MPISVDVPGMLDQAGRFLPAIAVEYPSEAAAKDLVARAEATEFAAVREVVLLVSSLPLPRNVEQFGVREILVSCARRLRRA